MSVDRLTKVPAAADTGRIAAHGLGLLGANLVFGALYFWGVPLLSWIGGGAWRPSPVGSLVFGGGSMMMPIDILVGLVVIAAGIWAVAVAARRLADLR